MEEEIEIDVPKVEEDTQTNKTPPKSVKTPRTEKSQASGLEIPKKWGRLLSLHPALPHVDLVAGIIYVILDTH